MPSDVNQTHIEKLESLPEGWAETSVSEIIQIVSTNQKKVAQKKYLAEGKFPIIDQGKKFIAGYSDDESLLINDGLPFIVFGDHTRTFKYVNFNFVPGADGVKVMKPLGVNSKWCFYMFQAIKLPNKGYARHFQYLKEAYLPIPPPEQQKRIVAKVDELFSHIDAGIEALKKAQKLLKQYRQSVLKAAVTGELTKGWREANKDELEPASELLERILKERRQKWEEQQLKQFQAKGKMPKDDKWKGKYKEPESLNRENNPELPEGWKVCVFDQLITELKNGISKKPAEESGLAIFRISAVRPMEIKKYDVRFLPNDFDSSGYEIEDDDLLFTRYNGNPELVGVCGKVNGLQRETVYPDKLMRARLVNKQLISPDYLELSLNCGISKEFIRSSTKTTAGQSGIAGGDVKKTPVILPSYKEQMQIAGIVDEKFTVIKHLEAELNLQLIKAGKNKQSILASAFQGKLIRGLVDDI